jgi:hypothetical protein
MFNRSSMAAVIAELDCIISFITASRTPTLDGLTAALPGRASCAECSVLGVS